MSRFIVDESKCRRDGICVALCPAGVLTRGDNAPPESVPGGEARVSSSRARPPCRAVTFRVRTPLPASVTVIVAGLRVEISPAPGDNASSGGERSRSSK